MLSGPKAQGEEVVEAWLKRSTVAGLVSQGMVDVAGSETGRGPSFWAPWPGLKSSQ